MERQQEKWADKKVETRRENPRERERTGNGEKGNPYNVSETMGVLWYGHRGEGGMRGTWYKVNQNRNQNQDALSRGEKGIEKRSDSSARRAPVLNLSKDRQDACE
jgi:hypothetical protein